MPNHTIVYNCHSGYPVSGIIILQHAVYNLARNIFCRHNKKGLLASRLHLLAHFTLAQFSDSICNKNIQYEGDDQ